MRTWLQHQRCAVPGFEAHSVIVADPGGTARIEMVAEDIADRFGLAEGQVLATIAPAERSLAAELRAACDLVALTGRAVPLECSVAGDALPTTVQGVALPATVRGGALPTIVRGVALPLDAGPGLPLRVQVVMSWRQMLGRSARDRLRRELSDALMGRTGPTTNVRAEPFPLAPAPRSAASVMGDHDC
jgi:hypothetical protein